MRERGRATNGAEDFGYVWIPVELLEDLEIISEEALRTVLYFHLAEHRAGEVGVLLALAEIAEHVGLGIKRTERGLGQLVKMGWVEKIGVPERWRLIPPPFSDG